MLKKYSSKSCVSLNVLLERGGNSHVTFTPRTGSGSVFYTDNEKIQKGLEKHPKFGKLFIEEKMNEQKEQKPASTTAPQPEPKTEGGVKELEFAVVEDAKDYIADKFGVSRSKLRTKAECEAAAEDNGIKINWKA